LRARAIATTKLDEEIQAVTTVRDLQILELNKHITSLTTKPPSYDDYIQFHHPKTFPFAPPKIQCKKLTLQTTDSL
jgi:ubiquitin-protein ligase